MAQKFFYVSAAILMLAFTYHLGARNAGAQSSNIVAAALLDQNHIRVVTQTGDVWDGNGIGFPLNGQYTGNIFSGGPTATTPTTLGRVKDAYRR